MPALILASTSLYRRELLERLRLPFETVAPRVDETPIAGETPAAAALRLARAKAEAVASALTADRADALVIGSDQTATLDGRQIIGKPGDHERARAQLRAASGREMVFHTALEVGRRAVGFVDVKLVQILVRFR
jgi:septum formation protein